MEKIERDGALYAIVHRKEDWEEGLSFITPEEMFCQVGTFWYQAGKKCKPHRHILNDRDNTFTQECNIILSGSIKAGLYDSQGKEFYSVILKAGDLMILIAGGHGFEVLEPDTKIVECKNGPFISVEKDKVLL
jgi:hypothetical protein